MHLSTMNQFGLHEIELAAITALLGHAPTQGFATTDELDEIWSIDEVPNFKLERTCDAEGVPYFVGTLTVSGVEYPCVALQDASPLGFFL